MNHTYSSNAHILILNAHHHILFYIIASHPVYSLGGFNIVSSIFVRWDYLNFEITECLHSTKYFSFTLR